MSKKLPKNTLENTQKIPETLEEQRDYYLKLYEKWARWQKESPEKLPEGYRTKVEFDFEKWIEMFYETDYTKIRMETKFNDLNSYLYLAQSDPEIDFLSFGSFFVADYLIKTFSAYNIGITKRIFLQYSLEELHFRKCFGILNLQNLTKNISLKFSNCTFSYITLENFDRGYFSPETNDYLNQMENDGKLTLINCTWSGLPVLRENYQTENKKDGNVVKFDFTKYIQAEYRDIFADFFMGLKAFVQYTRGIPMSIKISVNDDLLVEIEAEESYLEGIIRSFQEYVVNILPIINDQKPEITSTLSNKDSSTALIFLQNKVNSLEIQSQLRNNNLIGQTEKEQFFIGIIQKLREERHFLLLENSQLKSNNDELLAKVDNLNVKIQQLEIQKLDPKDRVVMELLLNNLAQLRLAIDSHDPSLIKSANNALKKFWQEHQWKINLAIGGFQGVKFVSQNKDSISDLIQYILTEVAKKF